MSNKITLSPKWKTGTTAGSITNTNSGNVGIGTTSPGYSLTVQQPNNTWGNIDTDGTTEIGLGIDLNQVGFLGSRSNHSLAFRTNNTERMRVDTSGNVGIGTTNPNRRLSVVGAGEASAVSDAGGKNGSILVSDSSAAAGNGGSIEFGFGANSFTQPYFASIKALGVSGTSNTRGDLAFFTRNAVTDSSLTERLRILSTGNVGIGTTAPGTKLDVAGDIQGSGDIFLSSATAKIRATTSDGSDNSYVSIMGGGTLSNSRGGFIILGGNENATYPGNILIRPGSNTGSYVELDSTLYAIDGKVGIGTTAPSYNLDVSGTLRTTGATSVGGNLNVSGGFLNLTSTTAFQPQVLVYNSADDATAGYWNSQKSRAGGPVQVGDVMGTFVFRGYDSGSVARNAAYIDSKVYTVGSGFVSGGLGFKTVNSVGTTITAMLLNGEGNVGIGTTSPVPGGLTIDKPYVNIDGTYDNPTTGGNLVVSTTDAQAAGIGGTLVLGGRTNDAANVNHSFGAIKGGKENSVTTNTTGYLGLYTQGGSGNGYLAERMRITSTGNVGIGTTSPNANAILDITSTTKAFMPPRMTTAQRDAIASPTEGMVIYNLTTHVLDFHNGTAWGAV